MFFVLMFRLLSPNGDVVTQIEDRYGRPYSEESCWQDGMYIISVAEKHGFTKASFACTPYVREKHEPRPWKRPQ